MLKEYKAPAKSSAVRSGNSSIRLQAVEEFKTRKFLEHVDVFIAPVLLADLAARPKNASVDMNRAQQQINRLKPQSPQVLSSIIVDKEGEILVAYCSYRTKGRSRIVRDLVLHHAFFPTFAKNAHSHCPSEDHAVSSEDDSDDSDYIYVDDGQSEDFDFDSEDEFNGLGVDPEALLSRGRVRTRILPCVVY